MKPKRTRWQVIYGSRLLALADKLDTIPKERFNFNQWIGDNWKGSQDLSCGTTACALGWAATMPKFRKLGLYILDRFSTGNPSVYIHRECEGVDAATTLFGISYTEATIIFTPFTEKHNEHMRFGRNIISQISPLSSAMKVAAHLRRFVRLKSL